MMSIAHQGPAWHLAAVVILQPKRCVEASACTDPFQLLALQLLAIRSTSGSHGALRMAQAQAVLMGVESGQVV